MIAIKDTVLAYCKSIEMCMASMYGSSEKKAACEATKLHHIYFPFTS
jgi:hypothetical protein